MPMSGNTHLNCPRRTAVQTAATFQAVSHSVASAINVPLRLFMPGS